MYNNSARTFFYVMAGILSGILATNVLVFDVIALYSYASLIHG
jgi:hypothetical protein